MRWRQWTSQSGHHHVSAGIPLPSRLITIQLVQHLGLLLQQYRGSLHHLKTTWSNPIVTMAQFEACIHASVEVAQSLGTGSLPPLPLPSQPTNQVEVEYEQAQDNVEDIVKSIPEPLDNDHLIVTDILATEREDQTYVDSDAGINDLNVEIIWEALVCRMDIFQYIC